jgi:hypothetical protein
MDWERRHLASVSKKHGLQTVFVGTALDRPKLHGNEIMVQVARPSWYPHDGGLETPLGTFVYTFKDKSGNVVARMVPAEEAEEWRTAVNKKRRRLALTAEEEALEEEGAGSWTRRPLRRRYS